MCIKYFFIMYELIYTKIYDYFFGKLDYKLSTPNLFNDIIKKLPPNSKILDLGCGNGICYDNPDTISYILDNNLQIIGIDINPIYIKYCKERIIKNNLSSNVTIILADIFEHKFPINFDYVIFSESAPLMSQEFLIKLVKYTDLNLLEIYGKIIFINNLTENPQNFITKIKPYLKYFTMIDFGRLLQKKDFINLANLLDKQVGFRIINKMSIDNVAKYFNLGLVFWIANMFGLKKYDIEQYEIIIE